MGAAFSNEPIYAVMALLGTLLFIIKMIMMIVGGDANSDLDGGDFEGDIDGPDHVDGSQSFTLVSVQSILAFFMGTGWIGLACREQWAVNPMPAVFVSAGFGFLMMLMSSYMNMKIKSLNFTPVNRIDKKAIGLKGRAYTDIPSKGKGMGQVEITINEKQQIIQAFSHDGAIKAFTNVRVIRVDDSGNLTVEAL